MNICFLCHNICSCGGTEKVVSTMSSLFTSTGHHCFALSLGKKGNTFFDFSNLEEIEYLYTDGNKLYVMHERVKKIKNFIRNKNIQLLITVGGHLNYYGWRTRSFHKWFAWEHEMFGFNNSLYVKLSRLLGIYYANQIIVLTDYDKKCFIEKWPKYNNRVIVIPNSTDNFVQKTGTCSKNVLAVGRLWDIKQFDLLIKAWARIIAHTSDWTLTIVGEGQERNNLEQLIQEHKLNNVFLPGFHNDISSYYNQSDIFAMTSLAEGFSLVLLEAMAHSLPIVGFYSDGGVSGLVDHTNGILLEQGDINGLSHALLQLIQDSEKRANLGKISYEKSLHYTNEQILAKWNSIIE